MTETALRAKSILTNEAFSPPEEDLLPLKWSILVWLSLAAVSWAGVYFVLSLVL